MGGREVAWPECGHVNTEWNSCRDRHCPLCQGARRELWIEDRREDLLPAHYMHVAFTLPENLNPWVPGNLSDGYAALLRAAWNTLDTSARKQGILPNMTALLHSWGNALAFHPHLHCIVTAGGRDLKTGRWKNLPWVKDGMGNPAFLFPVRALSAMFKCNDMAAFTSQMKRTDDARQECYAQKWVEYAKDPVSDVELSIEYIARYAYRVAISNRRIQQVTDDAVAFEWKDYKDGGMNMIMTLDGVELLRRYAMHVLPRGFFRRRHYGILAPKNMDWLAAMLQQTDIQPIDRCMGRRTSTCLAEQRGIILGTEPEDGLAHVVTVAYLPRARSPDSACTAVY